MLLRVALQTWIVVPWKLISLQYPCGFCRVILALNLEFEGKIKVRKRQ